MDNNVSSVEEQKIDAMNKIAKLSFNNLEMCDEPYFSAFSEIYKIATNPEKYYETVLRALDAINEKRHRDPVPNENAEDFIGWY